MVFVKNFVNDFYRVVQYERVLVLVNVDIDSICAVRILQSLFTCDSILYTIVPIRSNGDLETAFKEHIEGVKYVLMVNCGGSIDVVDLLQPEPEVVFFILDSHRPLCVENIYNAQQTRLLVKQEQLDGELPEYEDVFRDESDESEDELDSDGEPKRRRIDEDYLEKKQAKRKWEENRVEVLTNYMSTCYIGGSAALTLYQISFNMSKDTVEQLWWAIIAVTSQYIHMKIDYYHYFENIGVLQNHVSRVERRDENGEAEYSINCLKLSFDTDMKIDLYRHWNLYDALLNSLYTVSHFKTWSAKGRNKLHEFLADMGLPLAQCRQPYISMEAELRGRLKEAFNDHCVRFKMEMTSLFVPTFFAKLGYRNLVSAIDAVHVCAAVLNNVGVERDKSRLFSKAMDILKRSHVDDFENGLQLAVKAQALLMSQVHFLLSTSAVFPMSSFLYCVLSDSTTDPTTDRLRTAFGLEQLAHHLQRTWLVSEKCRKESHKSLPLIVLSPLGGEPALTLIVGIPPLETVQTDNSRNFLGEAFHHIVDSGGLNGVQERTDRHVITVETNHQEAFLESLLEILP